MVFDKFITHFSTVMGIVVAVVFALAASDGLLESPIFSTGDFHFACAGIVGTALALVLSLSIIPAQKAADVFSTAILKLYARDHVLWWVYATLAVLTLLSVLFGSGWAFGLDTHWRVVVQLILLGVALDTLREFYLRTLDLLVPQTALGLVLKDCARLMKVMAQHAHRVSRVFQVGGGKHGAPDPSSIRWLSFKSSPASQHLIGWINQLEEFAHKAVARRDTQATKLVLSTMAMIGKQYADMRRDSLVLVPDFSVPMPVSISDVGRVLNPIYERIKNICQDAARQPDEAVVAACINEIGEMAAGFMSIVHIHDKVWSTAPLVHTPVFYLKVCAEIASKAQMDDALLAAVRAIGPFYAQTSAGVHTLEAEATAIDCLFYIALSSYLRNSHVPADEVVQMMVAVAGHELRVRDFDNNNGLRTILGNFATLVPGEVAWDKAGWRLMHVFAPYRRTGLRQLLLEQANKIKTGDREWINPFHDFNELSEELVHHYRKLAKEVNFEGVLLERYIVASALDCADVHMQQLSQPPKGSERYLDMVEDRLIGFLHAPSFFFNETTSFPYYHADYAAGRLANLGIQLLRLKRPGLTKDCANALAWIGQKSSNAINADAYAVAVIFTKLEILARAANALGHDGLATECRAMEKRQKIIEKLPEYEEAIQNRTRHMDRSLAKRPRRDGLDLRDDPIPFLREILAEAEALKIHRRAIIGLLLNKYASDAAQPT